MNASEIEARVEFEANTGCWLWTGGTSSGYGSVYDPRTRQNHGAHRASYEAFVGPIPKGLYIDHKCRTRLCVNPAHLRAVTPRINAIENSTSVAAINAARTHCLRGHPLAGANLYLTLKGGRVCRTCNSDHHERARRAAGVGVGLVRGEGHHNTTLTERDIREIRAAPSGGRRLANLYGVNPSTIVRIRNREVWGHVQ